MERFIAGGPGDIAETQNQRLSRSSHVRLAGVRDREKNTITGLDNWPKAPRILEDVYSVTDAVVVGDLLISLLRHADRVQAASLAQLVNVIAPIMTEPGGPAWRQTTFYPFAETARRAVGSSLRLTLDSDSHDTALYGEVATIDAAGTHDAASGRTSLFLVNRDHRGPSSIDVDISALSERAVESAVVIADQDRHAANTLEQRERVTLQQLTSYQVDGNQLKIELPPLSWAALSLS